jgi:hypothetical protein
MTRIGRVFAGFLFLEEKEKFAKIRPIRVIRVPICIAFSKKRNG